MTVFEKYIFVTSNGGSYEKFLESLTDKEKKELQLVEEYHSKIVEE